MGPKGLILVSIAALAATAGGLAFILPGEPDPLEMQTLPVDRGMVRSVTLATGTVRPLVTTNVSTQVSGQVAEILVDFNDAVERGQLLARLDQQTHLARLHEAQAELEVARADLANREAAIVKAEAQLVQARARRDVAESEWESAQARQEEASRTLARKEPLAKRGGVSESELQTAQTELAAAEATLRAAEGKLRVAAAEIAAAEAELVMARSLVEYGHAAVRQREAALEEARVNLSRTEIRAPLEGIIIRRDLEEGQTVAASLQAPTLFTIAEDLARMRLETYVDEADIGRVRVGQAAFFSVDAYPERRFEGRVTSIRKSPNLVQNIVTYTVLVDADNPDLLLYPGMTAMVRIVVEEVADALRIPNAALRYVPPGPMEEALAEGIQTGEGRVLVWRLGADGSAEPVAVLTGASDDRHTELMEGGLTAGDRLITAHGAGD